MSADRRTAIVTGATRGIGAAIAKRLAADGFHVVVNYVSSEAEAGHVVDAIRATAVSPKPYARTSPTPPT